MAKIYKINPFNGAYQLGGRLLVEYIDADSDWFGPGNCWKPCNQRCCRNYIPRRFLRQVHLRNFSLQYGSSEHHSTPNLQDFQVRFVKIRTGGVFIYYQPFIGVITNTSIYNGAFWAHLSNYRFANGLPCLLKISFKQNQVMNWRGQAASPVYSKPDKPVFCCFKFCDKMGFVFFEVIIYEFIFYFPQLKTGTFCWTTYFSRNMFGTFLRPNLQNTSRKRNKVNKKGWSSPIIICCLVEDDNMT